MNRKILMIFVVFLAVAMLTTPLVAASPLIASVQAVTVDINGTLGGADYLMRIPSNWNGELIVFCRPFSILEPTPAYLASQADNYAVLVTMGYAFALSTFGAGGYCIKEGIIRTHQMTEYLIDNYDITGKVYLIGISLGGNIALLLGAKYPELYDGVLDIAGSKDLIGAYNDKMYYAGLNDADLTQAIQDNGGVLPPYPIPNLFVFRLFSLGTGTDIFLACGGNTPVEKPKAYERISPTFSAVDISVPTITVHGTADSLVPYSSSIAFMNAVTVAGHSDMYRLYKVDGGKHGDPALMTPAMQIHFPQLVAWVENGNPAPPSVT